MAVSRGSRVVTIGSRVVTIESCQTCLQLFIGTKRYQGCSNEYGRYSHGCLHLENIYNENVRFRVVYD